MRYLISALFAIITVNTEVPTVTYTAIPEIKVIDREEDSFFLGQWSCKLNDSSKFKYWIELISDSLELNPEHLIQIIKVESRMDSAVVNKTSKAKGFIQFLPSTAKSIRLTSWSVEGQMSGILTYLSAFKRKRLNLTQLYLLIHHPVSIDNDIIYSEGSTAYKWNRNLDVDKDGSVSRNEINIFVNKPVKLNW